MSEEQGEKPVEEPELHKSDEEKKSTRADSDKARQRVDEQWHLAHGDPYLA